MATQATSEPSSFVQSKSVQQAMDEGQPADPQTEDEWKTVLRTVLRLPHAKETLAVLLFLLDTLAFLRSTIDESSRGREDRTEVLVQYIAYVRAMYSLTNDATAACHAFTLSLALFQINRSILPSLAHMLATVAGPSSDEPTEAQKDLQGATLQALGWLQQVKDIHGHLIMKQPCSGSSGLLLNGEASRAGDHDMQARDLTQDAIDAQGHLFPSNAIDFSSLPSPNRLLQATLKRALTESQANRGSSPSTAAPPLLRKSSVLPIDVGVQRWALSSLLHHYLGEGYGQLRGDDGVTTYARVVRDDLAIRELFPDPQRFSVGEGELSPPVTCTVQIDQEQGANSSTMNHGTARDDKLKWLLGEAVVSQTVRRTSPLPGPLASAGATRFPTKKARMVARSPTAYQSRRHIIQDQEWFSDADLQELAYVRRRPTSSLSEPLSMLHRRACSADIDLAISGRYTRQSFDTVSSTGEWRGGISLSRIDSYETYDSQSHLIKHRHDSNEHTVFREDKSLVQSTDAPVLLSHHNESRASQPFTNFCATEIVNELIGRDPAPLAPLSLPSNSNDLTVTSKQHLVRKSRKLKAILGTEIEGERRNMGLQVLRSEMQVTECPRTPHLRRTRSKGSGSGADSLRYKRSESVDILRSTSGTSDLPQRGSRLSRSQSVGSSTHFKARRNSFGTGPVDTVQLSPIAASFASSDDGSSASLDAIVQRPLRTNADIARQARRRKLIKIQAFLGERVPASAITDIAGCPPQPLRPPGAVPIFSKASSRLQRRLTKSANRTKASQSDRENNGRNTQFRPQEAGMLSGSVSLDERSRSFSQTSDSNPEDANTAAWTDRSKPGQGLIGHRNALPECPARQDIGKAAEPVILAVRRARKLEKVFGSLPPAQLYARSNTWVARDDEHFAVDGLSLKSRASISSLQRARIASIRFIAESEDPELVQDFARVVLSEESDASDMESLPRTSLFDNGVATGRTRALQAGKVQTSAGKTSDDPVSVEERSEKLHDLRGKTTVAERQASFESGCRSAGDASRLSAETSSSRTPGLAKDLHLRLGLNSSPNSLTSGTNLFNQRYDPSQARKGRDSVLSAVTAQSSIGSAYVVDNYGRPKRSQSRTSHATSAEDGTPRSSMDSVRLQFRRAHKLATVFGTTRGEVFNRVLDDIEADIAEADDEDMDEDERKEIIESVTALRASL